MTKQDLEYEIDVLFEHGLNKRDVVELLRLVYNTAIEDAYENVGDSCESWCSLVKSWEEKLLSLRIK